MATRYQRTLYPASFRGFPFVVRETEGQMGRKNVVHNYPFRDNVWVEDMGRAPRQYEVEGFIVGDNVVQRLQLLLLLIEQPGPGILIHPQHGVRNVSVLSFSESSRTEENRVVRLRFSFIEGGDRIFPSIVANGFGAILSAAEDLFGAANLDFINKVGDVIGAGATVVAIGASTVATWAAAGNGLVQGASNLLHLSSSIAGSFGRFSGGRTGTAGNSIQGAAVGVGSIAAQVSDLIKQGATARTAVTQAGQTMIDAVGSL